MLLKAPGQAKWNVHVCLNGANYSGTRATPMTITGSIIATRGTGVPQASQVQTRSNSHAKLMKKCH